MSFFQEEKSIHQIALNMPNYGDPKYWDKRYSDNQGNMFDWLEHYDSLRPLFQ